MGLEEENNNFYGFCYHYSVTPTLHVHEMNRLPREYQWGLNNEH